ncbi:MAG: sialidase family protein [Planctomycetota bacterium]|nr:sialidase family protein [Planctomycetota bacterium]
MKIARISPMGFTPGKLAYHSFIRGGTGADYHQNPEFHQFADGELLLHWNAYDFDECSGGLVKLFSTSRDRGLTWSDPQVYMADFPGGVPYYALTLRLRDTNQALMLLNQSVHHAIEVDESRRVATAGSDYFKSKTRIFLRRSADGGRFFDHGVEIPCLSISGGKALPGVEFYGSADCLIQLGSGRLVAGFTFMDPARVDVAKRYQHYTGACLLSDDQGRTWRRSGEIHVDTTRGVMEIQFAETNPETEPGRLFCLFRTAGGCLHQTESLDGGQTWSPSRPSPLPAPESMARMTKLRSGKLLVVWNNVSSKTQFPRHPLVAALSADGGRTWGSPRVIAVESGTNQLSNHNLIQLDDGRILVAISHYHDIRPMTSDLDLALFDEAWLNGA